MTNILFLTVCKNKYSEYDFHTEYLEILDKTQKHNFLCRVKVTKNISRQIYKYINTIRDIPRGQE